MASRKRQTLVARATAAGGLHTRSVRRRLSKHVGRGYIACVAHSCMHASGLWSYCGVLPMLPEHAKRASCLQRVCPWKAQALPGAWRITQCWEGMGSIRFAFFRHGCT